MGQASGATVSDTLLNQEWPIQVLQDLATYPTVGQIVCDQEQQPPAQQEQLEQHMLAPADVICALNFSIFLLSSR